MIQERATLDEDNSEKDTSEKEQLRNGNIWVKNNSEKGPSGKGQF